MAGTDTTTKASSRLTEDDYKKVIQAATDKIKRLETTVAKRDSAIAYLRKQLELTPKLAWVMPPFLDKNGQLKHDPKVWPLNDEDFLVARRSAAGRRIYDCLSFIDHQQMPIYCNGDSVGWPLWNIEWVAKIPQAPDQSPSSS